MVCYNKDLFIPFIPYFPKNSVAKSCSAFLCLRHLRLADREDFSPLENKDTTWNESKGRHIINMTSLDKFG